MSVKGDMVHVTAAKCRQPFKDVLELLRVALEAVDDPNFAQAYADENYEGPADQTKSVGGDIAPALNDLMLDYWQVIRFLKDKL